MSSHPHGRRRPPAGRAEPAPCCFRVGTCGYSYTGWAESGFYPAHTPPGRMLPLYARQFPITELNATWHRMPRAEAVERERRLAPPGFQFTVKLIRELTHEGLPDNWRDLAATYRHGIAPLAQAGQLRAVLVQLPADFDRSAANRRRLACLLDELEGLPLAVEFRQGSWNTDRVFTELERRGVTLVAVDAPDMPGLFPALDVVTNPDLVYVRFHGRNARGWRQRDARIRFDYYYRESELREWVERHITSMARQSRSGVIVFNNHIRAQAPENALVLMRLLREYGLALAGE